MKATDITGRLGDSVMLTLEEVALLMHYGARAQGPIIDLGTYQAGSAIALAAESAHPVYSFDIHEDHDAGGVFAFAEADRDAAIAHIGLFGVGDRVFLKRERSTDAALSWCEPVGLVFVDADPADALANVDGWGPFVLPGGWLILHNIGEESVQEAAAYLLEGGDWLFERARDRTAVYRKRADAEPYSAPEPAEIVEPHILIEKPKRKRKAG